MSSEVDRERLAQPTRAERESESAALLAGV